MPQHERISVLQKDRFVEIMTDKSLFLQGRHGNGTSRVSRREEWDLIADELNGLGPAKAATVWKTCWRNMKNKTKTKYGDLRSFMNRTGGDKPNDLEINATDDKILAIICREMGLGLTDVPESGFAAIGPLVHVKRHLPATSALKKKLSKMENRRNKFFNRRVTTDQQFEKLVSFLEEHPYMVNGRRDVLYTRENCNELWTEVADQLNALGPPGRNPVEWKKVWADCRVKAVKDIRQFYLGTDNNRRKKPPTNLTQLQHRIGALLKIDTKEFKNLKPRKNRKTEEHKVSREEDDDNSDTATSWSNYSASDIDDSNMDWHEIAAPQLSSNKFTKQTQRTKENLKTLREKLKKYQDVTDTHESSAVLLQLPIQFPLQTLEELNSLSLTLFNNKFAKEMLTQLASFRSKDSKEDVVKSVRRLLEHISTQSVYESVIENGIKSIEDYFMELPGVAKLIYELLPNTTETDMVTAIRLVIDGNGSNAHDSDLIDDIIEEVPVSPEQIDFIDEFDNLPSTNVNDQHNEDVSILAPTPLVSRRDPFECFICGFSAASQFLIDDHMRHCVEQTSGTSDTPDNKNLLQAHRQLQLKCDRQQSRLNQLLASMQEILAENQAIKRHSESISAHLVKQTKH